jgi:probable F420-dependent oxidoreductase
MRFTLTTGMGDYPDWHAMAIAAEDAGFTSFSIPDSTFFPKQSDSIYPYDDTAVVRGYIENTPFIEPMIAFTWMAAVTKKIRFYPNVMKVPVRSPIILAKLIGSLAAVSNNRFVLGAGIGPWEEDFRYNNLDWTKRGELLDESLDIIKGLLAGGFFEYHGKHYDIGPIKMNPVPTEPVKVIVGGHAKPALRRAARVGDGWVSVKGSDEEFKTMIDTINGYRDDYGTRDKPFEFHVGSFDFHLGETPRTLDDFRRLEEIGATDYCLLPFLDPATTQQQKVDVIHRFGDEVIAKLG